MLSPRIEIKLDSIGTCFRAALLLRLTCAGLALGVFDTHMNVMYVEGEQKFKLFFLPIRPVPAR